VRIDELLRQYLLERDLEPASAKQFLTVLTRFDLHLKRRSEADDFKSEIVNAWLTAMLNEGLSRRTVRGYGGRLLTLWRWAFDVGHVQSPPSRVKKISVPDLIPVGFTRDELERLLAEAAKLTGCFRRSKVSRPHFAVALLRVVWDSGLRAGDLRRLTRMDYAHDGLGVILQGKTGWPKTFRLSPSTMEAIEATYPPERTRIFGDAISRRRLFKWVKRIVDAAGMTGGTKKIRKGGASAVENAQPGGAMRYLGHRTPGLAARFYLDPRIVGGNPPGPPELPSG